MLQASPLTGPYWAPSLAMKINSRSSGFMNSTLPEIIYEKHKRRANQLIPATSAYISHQGLRRISTPHFSACPHEQNPRSMEIYRAEVATVAYHSHHLAITKCGTTVHQFPEQHAPYPLPFPAGRDINRILQRPAPPRARMKTLGIGIACDASSSSATSQHNPLARTARKRAAFPQRPAAVLRNCRCHGGHDAIYLLDRAEIASDASRMFTAISRTPLLGARVVAIAAAGSSGHTCRG